MITIDLGTIEYYDSKANEFAYEEGGIVRFEYSLLALYNWEGKWKKPFLKGNLTTEELIDFYVAMAIDPIDRRFITSDVMMTLSTYIADGNTATTISSGGTTEGNATKKGKIYTAEEIYALMFMNGVDIDMEHRNLNRLMTMLSVIGSYNSPPKKMSKEDILRQNARLNAERRAKLKTRG